MKAGRTAAQPVHSHMCLQLGRQRDTMGRIAPKSLSSLCLCHHHLSSLVQFVVEALRGGEGPPLARHLVATLPSLLQLQVPMHLYEQKYFVRTGTWASQMLPTPCKLL